MSPSDQRFDHPQCANATSWKWRATQANRQSTALASKRVGSATKDDVQSTVVIREAPLEEAGAAVLLDQADCQRLVNAKGLLAGSWRAGRCNSGLGP